MKTSLNIVRNGMLNRNIASGFSKLAYGINAFRSLLFVSTLAILGGALSGCFFWEPGGSDGAIEDAFVPQDSVKDQGIDKKADFLLDQKLADLNDALKADLHKDGQETDTIKPDIIPPDTGPVCAPQTFSETDNWKGTFINLDTTTILGGFLLGINQTSGSYSMIIDANTWGKNLIEGKTITFNGMIKANTNITVETRSGNNSNDAGMSGGSNWANLSGNTITSPAARFLEFRFNLTSQSTSTSPEFYDYTVSFCVK